MRSNMLLRGACAVIGVGALVAAGTGTAAGAEPAPTPCGALNFKDVANDQVDHQMAPSADQTPSTDLLGGFLLHNPTKGAEATTFNIVAKDLKREVPANYLNMIHFGNYVFAEKQIFIRAITDFTGASVFEWGEFTPNPAGPVVLTGASVYKGTTTGNYFEGPNGVVQIVIPAEAGGTGNSQLTSIYAEAGQSRTSLPTSFPPHATRGLTAILDTAPDAGGESTVKWTASPCTVAGPAPGGGTTVSTGGTTGGATGATGSNATGSNPSSSGGGTSNVPETGGVATLPIKVSSAKAPKKKSLALKLRSSEPVTDIGARLRKGSKAVGTGKLAKLGRTGTLKLKLSKKLKKGSYQLDLAGTLADGRRGVVSLKLKLK